MVDRMIDNGTIAVVAILAAALLAPQVAVTVLILIVGVLIGRMSHA